MTNEQKIYWEEMEYINAESIRNVFWLLIVSIVAYAVNPLLLVGLIEILGAISIFKKEKKARHIIYFGLFFGLNSFLAIILLGAFINALS